MKIKADCTYWTVEWTKRIDGIGRRYTDLSCVYIDGHERNAEGMWKAMGFTKASEGTWPQTGKPTSTWVNGDASTVITRQVDTEIEYEIHKQGNPPQVEPTTQLPGVP
jgi:hypothetical protein